MKPLTLSARNLRTWGSLAVSVPEGITAIVGPNGAGKSTLVSAIDLALFGTGREMKRALSRGAGEEVVEVELVFEHGGETYRVTRGYNTRSGGKPELRLERETIRNDETVTIREDGLGWVSLAGTTVSETQEKLETLLGLSRQTFRASSYLAQDDGAAFTMAEPRERKAILLDALGVRVWDRLLSAARELRTDAERDLSKTIAQVEALEGRLAELDAVLGAERASKLALDAVNVAVEDLENGLQVRRQELEEAVRQEAEAEARRGRQAEASRRHDEALKREADLAQKIAELDSAGEKRTTLVALTKVRPHLEKVVELREEAAALISVRGRLEHVAEAARQDEGRETKKADDAGEAIAALEEELRGIDEHGATCPTCGQALAGDALEEARRAVRARMKPLELHRDHATDLAVDAAKRGRQAELELEKATVELEKWKTEDARVSELIPDSLRVQTPRAGLAQVAEAERLLAVLDERLAGLEEMKRDLGAIRQELPTLRRDAGDANAAAGEVAGTSVAEHREKIEKAEAALRHNRHRAEEAAAAHAKAQARVEGLEQAAADLETFNLDRAIRQGNVELFKLAEKAFGRDGIPALIIERSLPELEANANRIVAELGREYRFELRTQRATQAGDVKEVLDIVVFTESGAALYEDFSGGERARIDLALRIALARLLAARRGTDVRLLAIDEPSFLDDDGFEKLAGVLRSLTGEFDSILVVSHVEELRDAFDSAIVVAGGADTGEPSRLAGDEEPNPMIEEVVTDAHS